jgi:hypothetical protein
VSYHFFLDTLSCIFVFSEGAGNLGF